MKKRLGILGVVLGVRLIIGGVLSRACVEGEKVRLAGIVEKVDQTDSKTVIWLKDWGVEMEKNRKILTKNRVKVVGSCGKRVIDFLLSRNRLIEGQVLEVGENIVAKAGLSLWLDNFRLRLIEIYQKQLPWPESALVAGIVIGYQSNLGEFYDKLVNAGVIHIVVASGYNVAIVAVVVLNILIQLMKRKWATLGAMGAIIFYVFLAGGQPPVVRAAIMGSLVFVGKAYGKQVEAKWLLWLTAWVMVMIEPALLASVSFQLSVAATGGILYFEPIIRGGMEYRNRVLTWMAETELAPTLAAQAATLPIILWHFGRVSLVAPLTNILVLPLVPPLMGVGAMQLLLGLMYKPLGLIVGWMSWSLAKVIVMVVRILG